MSISISIVIPARNGEQYLYAAIASALAQTRPADEIIVVDDASEDRTAAVARLPEFSGRVAFRSNDRPTGFADAWNRAVRLSRGDFVAILHQDDLLHKDYLLHVEKALSLHPRVRHLYAACDYVDENGAVVKSPPRAGAGEPVLYTGSDYAHRYLEGVWANRHIHRCPGVTTARSLLLHECPYRREAGHLADDDFFLRVGAFTDVVGISAPLASYRHHARSTTSLLDNLARALAEAYLFQVRHYRTSPGVLGGGDLGRLHSLAVRFVNLLLFQGVSSGDGTLVSRAVALRSEYESMFPGDFSPRLPLWARGVWGDVRRTGRPSSIGNAYVALLKVLMKIRAGVPA